MTEEKARPPTDSEDRVWELLREAREALREAFLLIARQNPLSLPEIKQIDRASARIDAALGEARGTASASESTKEQGAPEGASALTAEEIAQARKEESERWRARYGDSEDALHKALTLLRWIADNEEEAFDINREAWRDEWPAKDTRARLLDEWDKKMVEAKTLAARLGEAPGDAPTAPPAPDLLRENARLREDVATLQEFRRNLHAAIEKLENELARARAAHLENATLLAKAQGALREAEAPDPWREALIELLDLKNLISEDLDNIRIDRCPASGRGDAHGEHRAGEWVAWDSDYPDEGAISLKGLIAPAHIAVVDDALVQGEHTVRSLIAECKRLNAGSLKIIARDGDDRILSAVVVLSGHETAEPMLAAIEALETEWEAEDRKGDAAQPGPAAPAKEGK